MFDFDPGFFEDAVDEVEMDHDSINDIAEDESCDDDFGSDPNDLDGALGIRHDFSDGEGIIGKAVITGAIFGMGRDEGVASTEEVHEDPSKIQSKKLARSVLGLDKKKDERSPGAVSLFSESKEQKVKRRPFEQWIHDVCRGRKTINDDL